MNKKIIYLIFQPAPSAVVRAEVFKDLLLKNNFDARYVYLYSKTVAKVESKIGISLLKTLLRGIQRVIRYWKTRSVSNELAAYDGIVLLKYVSPNTLLTVRKKSRAKILYDFDDAVWLPLWLGEQNFEKIISAVDYVSCDNAYLKMNALKFNQNTFIVNGPSQIELFDTYVPLVKENSEIVIGWIGSATTLFYVDLIYDALEEIGSRHRNVSLHLVGTGAGNLKIPSFKKIKVTCFPTYDQKEMVAHVKNFDIGLYPLRDDALSLGRGSLKATIYMAGKVPAVCSALGENCNIITHGQNGLLAKSIDEWVECLEMLIRDPFIRKNIGLNGYEYARKNLNLESCFDQLTSGFLNKI